MHSLPKRFFLCYCLLRGGGGIRGPLELSTRVSWKLFPPSLLPPLPAPPPHSAKFLKSRLEEWTAPCMFPVWPREHRRSSQWSGSKAGPRRRSREGPCSSLEAQMFSSWPEHGTLVGDPAFVCSGFRVRDYAAGAARPGWPRGGPETRRPASFVDF